MNGQRFDDLARTLATPMPRRRAIVVISGAVAAASFWRPKPAGAAGINCPQMSDPTGTQKCEVAGGAAVCVPPDWSCCSTPKCAGACAPAQKCTAGGSMQASCDDSPRLCRDPRLNGLRPRFCSVTLMTGKGFCTDAHPQVSGWCCRAEEKCGDKFGDCQCEGGRCGFDLCCKKSEYCDVNYLSANECKKLCPDGSRRCGYECCTSDKTCGGSECECRSPLVSRGSQCVKPEDNQADPKVKSNALQRFFDMMSASGASHSTTGHLMLFRQAGTTTGPDAAVLALGAMNAQAGAALTAFTDGHGDSSFAKKVTVARAVAPKVTAAAGLNAKSAAALNALFAAEAKANAQIAAAATALARSRSAHAKHKRSAAKAQLLASAAFAEKAAISLKPVPGLRTRAANTLTAAGVAEVSASADDVAAMQKSVRGVGIPADLRALTNALKADPARVRAGLQLKNVSVGALAGPVLIAPLADTRRAAFIRQQGAALRSYARSARRHPHRPREVAVAQPPVGR